MQSKTFKVCNLLGLHVRASSKLVDLACSFISSVKIVVADKEIDVKRILQVMSLGLKYQDEFAIIVHGDDEFEAMVAIELLILSGFGEN